MPETGSQTDVLEATLHGGSVADVLGAMRGQGHAIDEFTVLPAQNDGRKVALVVPPVPHQLKSQPWHRSPEEVLSMRKGVGVVRGMKASAREHLRLILNCHHDQAGFLRYIITRLGGSIKAEKGGEVRLQLTSDIEAIGRILEFLHAMEGLGSRVRVNPVHESLASRPEVDDLAAKTDRKRTMQPMEEVTLRIIGDGVIGPQLDVIRQLETEGKNVEIVQLSCHPHPPKSESFEMIVVLRMRDTSKLDAFRGGIISGHAGVYGADIVTPDKSRQTVQVVTDESGALDLAKATGGALQRSSRRGWGLGDPRFIVSGSLITPSAARIVTDVAEAHVPHSVTVPIALVPRPVKRPEKIRHGHGAFSGLPDASAEAPKDYIIDGLRRYLLELLDR